ncbi:MAG: hypothetical protein MI923_18915 [Phycisphaerales bacterium]|nr:hypothetical protein [Phycisphaerales bacterium]
MPSLISHLSRPEQRELFDDLNYLNLQEIRFFCKKHSIPYSIWVETKDGQRTKTKDTDRKSVVLGRVRHFLKTGRVLEATCFAADVVRLIGPPKKLTAQHRLYYGWYDKKNKDMINLLRRLTGGEFRNGAIARILAREFWTNGKAPTFAEFARAWTEANKKGLWPHPEAAWLTDRARNQAGSDWKAKRERKAKAVLKIIGEIPPGR